MKSFKKAADSGKKQQITKEEETVTKNADIQLFPTAREDLNALFRFQLDKEANYLAAFTPMNPNDKTAYIDKWTKLLVDSTVTMRTIRVNDEIAGSVVKYVMDGNAEITYWIDRKFWGQGIATIALKKFLTIEKTRPILGHVAFDNYGSQKVLEKCGFIKIGTERNFANARQTEIEEYIYQLAE